MTPKVLVVLTSHDKINATGNPTGWYLPEFAHPHEVLHKKVSLTIASPKGGEAPLDPASVKMSESDPVAQKFLKEQKALWSNTHKLADILPHAGDFDAIFYVGGHGPMFDLTTDPISLALIQTFAAANKPVAAVCHAPCVLLNATAPSGVPLISGVSVTGFSNAEEDAVGLSSAMPFMLETELGRVTGGKYVKAAEAWGEMVVVGKAAGTGSTIITGQNPGSATGVGKAILAALGL
ncbi:ThiJ/PfpI [Penicillium cf. griseofulvum]|uniref:D-lactate dehydratase n=1 Tax=Penicillium cf. griseofulvum TaxID=2972120 RepID=A0A9W9N030_9EURO|nr:ThiJ/PfpI [Penicillium cf. griseofulvum]KAJ5422112.1 ThiJ/PfpI [Penicillium cf. griseofulvum]KAJ5428300.1 ThiJ/PfpI [Penicillium cf. griseofulvum]